MRFSATSVLHFSADLRRVNGGWSWTLGHGIPWFHALAQGMGLGPLDLGSRGSQARCRLRVQTDLASHCFYEGRLLPFQKVFSVQGARHVGVFCFRLWETQHERLPGLLGRLVSARRFAQRLLQRKESSVGWAVDGNKAALEKKIFFDCQPWQTVSHWTVVSGATVCALCIGTFGACSF